MQISHICMMFNRLWFDIAIFLVQTIMICWDTNLTPPWDPRESPFHIFEHAWEWGSGEGGGSLLRTWETQSVGRRACGGAASPAFQICDMWLSLALIKLRTFVSTCLIVSAGCETQSIGKYVRVLWSYKTRSLLILGKFKLKRGEMLPAILIPDSDM